MASGVNKVILIGNLGKDPELRHTPNGTAVADVSLATNESWIDKEGKKQEKTEWHRIVVWGARAEALAKYKKKGEQLYVEGKLQTKSWDDKEGNKRYTTEIVAVDIQYIGGKGDTPVEQSTHQDSDPF